MSATTGAVAGARVGADPTARVPAHLARARRRPGIAALPDVGTHDKVLDGGRLVEAVGRAPEPTIEELQLDGHQIGAQIDEGARGGKAEVYIADDGTHVAVNPGANEQMLARIATLA